MNVARCLLCVSARTRLLLCVCVRTQFANALTRVCLRVRLCLRHALFCILYLVILAEVSSGCVPLPSAALPLHHKPPTVKTSQLTTHTHTHTRSQCSGRATSCLQLFLSSFSPQGNWRTRGCHGNWPLAPAPN